MNEQEAIAKMIAPGTRRPGKYREGVIQIHVTRACDKACFGCTQGSNLGGKTHFMSPDHFRDAVRSLDGYFGVVGVFGGNPATSTHFSQYCSILQELVPFERRGIWCNHPISPDKARLMRETFDPSVSNLNVHLDRQAYDMFVHHWPESRPFGLDKDSRHSPPWVAMKDVLKRECRGCQYCNAYGDAWKYDEECDGSGTIYDESRAWELISGCDINQHWSAMIGVFRGQLRAWFCEIAGAQSILHQDDPNYPDTGFDPTWRYEHETAPGDRIERTVGKWWQLGMINFARQVRKHCHDCGVPLRGYGELAQADKPRDHYDYRVDYDDPPSEQVSHIHQDVFKVKRSGRAVELVTTEGQLRQGRIQKFTHYLQNSER